jgi:nucleoside-diphosphate-sugar epimerase
VADPQIRRSAAGRVLVTGATGFIGSATAAALERAGHEVIRAARALPAGASPQRWVVHGDIGPATPWQPALAGIDAVVHAAGLAHLPDESAARAAEAFDRVNATGTARLAAAASAAGVRRFVLLSSALVHGWTHAGRPLTEADTPAPQTAYARSKLDAEQRLRDAAGAQGTMSWVVLRPPLVYGPGVKANFRRLMRIAATGLPIPLGAATAPKSFIGIDNFASAIARCLAHAGAANQTFLVCDAETTSTADVIGRLAAAQGRRAWLPAVPATLLRPAFAALGRGRDFDRLFAPLAIDCQRIRTTLAWTPPVSLDEGLRRAVATG